MRYLTQVNELNYEFLDGRVRITMATTSLRIPRYRMSNRRDNGTNETSILRDEVTTPGHILALITIVISFSKFDICWLFDLAYKNIKLKIICIINFLISSVVRVG